MANLNFSLQIQILHAKLELMKENQKGFAIILLPLIVGGILIVGYLFKTRYFGTYESHPFVIPSVGTNITTTETPKEDYPVDTENDGVYTDYKYNFTFTYPKNIFISQSEQDIDAYDSSIFWYSTVSDLSMAYPIKPWIRVRTTSSPTGDGSFDRNFNTIYNQTIGEFSNETGTIKLKELHVENGKGFVFYVKPKENADVVPFSYQAAWSKGKDVIWLGLNMEEEDKNKSYQKIFNEIVNSFKFTE